MGRPAKKKRWSEAETFANIVQYTQPGAKSVCGHWFERFKNHNPIILELACGKGDYTVALAQIFPHRNFIGIDVKGERMWRGAKTALEKNLTNVLFFRTYIDHLAEYFATGEVEELWITFPDPHPTDKGARKRLTSPRFLTLYQKILQPRGALHLKTDDEPLFEFSLQSLKDTGWVLEQEVRDIYKAASVDPLLEIQTAYEKRHLAAGKKIYYLRATSPAAPAPIGAAL